MTGFCTARMEYLLLDEVLDFPFMMSTGTLRIYSTFWMSVMARTHAMLMAAGLY